MRILFWSETFWPRVGGVENLASRLLPALQHRGYEFSVVTWENTNMVDVIHLQNIPVYRFPFFSSNEKGSIEPMMKHLHEVSKLKRDFRPDLIHVNSFGRSVAFHLSTANVYPVSMLFTMHQRLPDEPVTRESLLGRTLEQSEWVTACSAAVLDHACQLVPQIRSRSSVIRNAMERPKLKPQPLPIDPPRMLFLGRLVPEKGLDWALEGLSDVFSRFPDACLVIAGDGPERKVLERKTKQLGLAHSVKFLGSVPVESVPLLLNDATLVMIPSRTEGFGLVALEAAMMGRPVVATRVGGLPEVVVDGQTGLLVDQGDCSAWAQAILKLFSDHVTATRFGEAARKRALEVFDWERYVDTCDALYRRLGRLRGRVVADRARLRGC